MSNLEIRKLRYTIPDIVGLQTELDNKTSGVSLGNILFVSSSAPVGNDAQSRADALGRIDKPFRTIQAAVNVALNNDTIVVFAGNYTENISYSNKTVFFDFQGRCVLNGNIDFLENNFAGHYIHIEGKQTIINGKIIASGNNGVNITCYVSLFQINSGSGYAISDTWLSRANFRIENTIINCEHLHNSISSVGKSYFNNCTINASTISNSELNRVDYTNCNINTAILGVIRGDSASAIFYTCKINLTSTSIPLLVNFTQIPIIFKNCEFTGSCTDVFIVNTTTGRSIGLELNSCDFQNYTFGNGIAFYNPDSGQPARLVITNTILKTGTNTYKAGSVPTTVEVLNNLIYI